MQIVIFFVLFLMRSFGMSGKILEIQAKTSSDNDSGKVHFYKLENKTLREGMNGGLNVEICDTDLNCCNAGTLDSDRDDFNKGHVDVFYGNMINGCEETVLSEGPALMIVTHNGIDGWKGDWIRYRTLITVYMYDLSPNCFDQDRAGGRSLPAVSNGVHVR